MIKPIVKDTFFLSQKSATATRDDLQVGRDLQDTLEANRAGCILRVNRSSFTDK